MSSSEISPEAERLFTQIDKDKNGTLSVFEMKDALALGNISLSMQQSQALMRLFHRSDSQNIQLTKQEFEALHNFMMETVNIFKLFDSEDNGKLSKQAAAMALENLDFRLSEAAMDSLFKSCDPDQTNSLTLNEWITMNVMLKGSRAVFQAFSNGGNAITLTEDQLIFAVAHIV